MHKLLGFLGLLLGFVTAAPAGAQTVKLPPGAIRWAANRPLTVADFRGRPRATETHAALTSANINTGATCRDNLFAGTALASFDPATSWVRDPAHLTPALLRHEQLHFDIAEVYARRLRQQLAGVHTTCNKLGNTFDRVAQAAYKAWEQSEENYDRDTRHGLDAARQAQWEAQVRQELQSLADFADSDA